MRMPALVEMKSEYRKRGMPRSSSRPSGFAYVRPKRAGIIALAFAGMGLGVLLGSIAFFKMTGPVKRAESRPIVIERVEQVEMAELLVPVARIDEGTALNPSMFMRVRRPKVGIPPDAIESYDQLRGGYAKHALLPNYPVQASYVSQEKSVNAVVANIPPGFRAVAIHVNATSGVEGWARAGAHVDVHWINDVLGERTATLLVKNALVLSAERQINAEAASSAPVPTTVTLLATEPDAQKISLASSAGSLVLHLRGSADQGKLSSGVSTISFKDLLAGRIKDEGADDIEGVARTTNPDGTIREWAISRGRLMSRKR